MIVAQLTGGLGNQMFQYAFARYLAEKHKTELKLDTSILLNRIPCGLTYYKYDLGIYDLQSEIASEKDIPQYTPKKSVKNIPFRVIHLLQLLFKGLKYIREGQFHFNPKFLELSNNVYLDGYWQTEKYFKSIESIIRKDFTFNFKLQGLSYNMGHEIDSNEAVCVHIRRGDYLKFIEHHGVVGNDYVSKGVEIIASKIQNAHFFVFSNDIAWCQENLKFNYPTTFITSENAGSTDKEHFQLMTKCKHFVIANSTFSWWAAWLSINPNKIVVAPEKWVNNPKINTKDIIPESWIKI